MMDLTDVRWPVESGEENFKRAQKLMEWYCQEVPSVNKYIGVFFFKTEEMKIEEKKQIKAAYIKLITKELSEKL